MYGLAESSATKGFKHKGGDSVTPIAVGHQLLVNPAGETWQSRETNITIHRC